MNGIGGITSFGNVDLAGWLGLNGVSGVAATPVPQTSVSSTTALLAAAGVGGNLQLLVQVLQQFSIAEVLLALLLASNLRTCDRRHDHSSAIEGLAAFALTSALLSSGLAHGTRSAQLSSTTATAGTTLNIVG